MKFQWRFSQRASTFSTSIIREILKLTEKENVISFAGGAPEPSLLPVAQITEATLKVLKERPTVALQYSITEGYFPLREFLAERFSRQGIRVGPENILITQGSQQGLDLLARVFIDPGDIVVTEQPTYLGAIQSFSSFQARFCSIPIDAQGLRTEALEEALSKHTPRLLYVLPNFQNPAGVTLALERRQTLAQLSVRYQIPVIEDDPYRDLRYSGEDLPSITSLECMDNSILLGTISKTITPGHRLGWVVAPAEVMKRLVMAKQAADLHTNTFSQHVIYEFCRAGNMEKHLQFLRHEYCKKRDAMLASMEKYFPGEATWTETDGGLYLWVTLPPGLSSVKLLEESIKNGVAFVPGVAFFTNGEGDNHLRLSFSNASLEKIEQGIRRLGESIKALMEDQKKERRECHCKRGQSEG